MGNSVYLDNCRKIPVKDSAGLSRRSIDSHSRTVGAHPDGDMHRLAEVTRHFLLGVCLVLFKPKQILIGLSGKPPVGAIIYEHLKKSVVFCDTVPFFRKIYLLSFYCVPFCIKNNHTNDGIGPFLFCHSVFLLEKVLFTVQGVLFVSG